MNTILIYGLALLGVGLVALQVMAGQAANVNYVFARVTLVNLLRTNPRMAEAQCKALPGTFFAPVGAAIGASVMAQSRDLATLSASNRPAYDGASQVAAMFWRQLLTKAKLGAGMAGGGLALAISGKQKPIIVIVCALLGVFGLGWLWWRQQEAERAVVLARAEILPEVDRVFVDGRY